MFLQIENFFSTDELASLSEISRHVKYIEGRRSNPHNTTKDNQIGDPGDLNAQKASQVALLALQRNEAARNFVFPQRMAVPSICRYAAGMKYGAHVDAAYLPLGGEPLRSDVSCTMFVSDPGGYQGGELVIHMGTEVIRMKGRAGSAVFYPSTTLHEVVPVSAGERIVLITFIESQIADQQPRDLLYALGEVRALEGLKMDWRNRTQLEYVIANLHRMWSK
jgi:PKHD-type hydroxylase